MPETQAAAPGTKPLLTRQERKVLSLKEEGLSASAIAKRLFVSKRTVNFHCYNAYRKLGVNNAIRAINAARALGLLVDTSALEVRAQ